MHGVGTSEPFIGEDLVGLSVAAGGEPAAMHWRKPLRVDEINRLAQTPEVRRREGRP